MVASVANWFRGPEKRKQDDERERAIKEHAKAVEETREAVARLKQALGRAGTPEDLVATLIPEKKRHADAD